MDASQIASSRTAQDDARTCGHILSVSGSQASVGLPAESIDPKRDASITVGKFLRIQRAKSLLIGMVTEVTQDIAAAAHEQGFRAAARLDMMGEIKQRDDGAHYFQRGVTDYPAIGDPAALITRDELRLIYDISGSDTIDIGYLQQDASIGAYINVDEMLSKHFAVLGTTGVGKSSGVALILRQILDARPNLRLFLLDGHNEYARCFGDRALVLNPRNLKLPFWLFNFEETIDVFFGGRPGVDEEVAVLAELIPQAKSNYTQNYRTGDRPDAQARRPEDDRLHRRHAGAVSPRRPRRADRRAHGQAREPLLAHDLSQADPAHRNRAQRSALRLHVRQRQRRRRHDGRDAAPAVPPAGRRQADDDHAARRLPGRGGRIRSCRCSAAWRSISACGATARSRCCSCARKRTATPPPTARSASGRPARRSRASPRKAANTACSSAS